MSKKTTTSSSTVAATAVKVEATVGSASNIIGGSGDFKPGQKYPTPSPGNGDRVFYETLIEQTPSSEMAQEWCLAYGILSLEKAIKLNAIVCKRKGKPVSASPMVKVEYSSSKSISVVEKKVTTVKRRRVVDDDDIVGDTGQNIYFPHYLTTTTRCIISLLYSILVIIHCLNHSFVVNIFIPGFEASSSWEGVGTAGI